MSTHHSSGPSSHAPTTTEISAGNRTAAAAASLANLASGCNSNEARRKGERRSLEHLKLRTKKKLRDAPELGR